MGGHRSPATLPRIASRVPSCSPLSPPSTTMAPAYLFRRTRYQKVTIRATTSPKSLREFTCACCAEAVSCSECKVVAVNDYKGEIPQFSMRQPPAALHHMKVRRDRVVASRTHSAPLCGERILSRQIDFIYVKSKGPLIKFLRTVKLKDPVRY